MREDGYWFFMKDDAVRVIDGKIFGIIEREVLCLETFAIASP